MSPRVSIDFTGLCLFATKNVPERLSVLLAADPSRRMVHRPLVSFDVRNLGSFSGDSVDQVIQLSDGRQIVSWCLDKHIVTVSAGKSAQPDSIVLCRGSEPSSRCPQNPVSEMDLWWVPSLKRVTGAGEINPAYLSSKPVPHSNHSPLAGRLDFDRGFVYSNADVNRSSAPTYWRFVNDAGPAVEQYLADTVRLEIQPGPDEPLVFEATPFHGDKTVTLELRPWNDRIDLSITNLPVELPKPGMPGMTKSMQHFEFYYDLLKPVPKNKPIPTSAESWTCGQKPPASKAMAHVAGTPRGVHPVKCTPSLS